MLNHPISEVPKTKYTHSLTVNGLLLKYLCRVLGQDIEEALKDRRKLSQQGFE